MPLGIPENLLKRIDNQQGYNKSQRKYDPTAHSAEDLWVNYPDELPNLQIDTRISPDGTSESTELIGITEGFVTDMAKRYEKAFLSMLREYQEQNPQMSDKIIDFLQLHGLTLPSFKIYDPDNAKAALSNMHHAYNQLIGLDPEVDGRNSDNQLHFACNSIDPNSLLLVINIPKPLAQFWWKTWMAKEPKTNEWGVLYESLMPVIWNSVDESYKFGIDLCRINAVGVHHPQHFYYIFEVGAVAE